MNKWLHMAICGSLVFLAWLFLFQTINDLADRCGPQPIPAIVSFVVSFLLGITTANIAWRVLPEPYFGPPTKIVFTRAMTIEDANELLDWLETRGLRGKPSGPDANGMWRVHWEETSD